MSDLVAGRYELQGKLGEGSVAEVYRALDRDLNRLVAIKFLRAEAQERDTVRQRFVREARAIAKVSHPNLITVHDAGETDDGRMFIVMELVEGRTLDYFMKERAIAPKEAADIIRRVALGLQHAHEAGIIHRDLKPANILVTPAGDPKIVDFGLARLREGDSLMTKPGMIVGTPRYMAPEQVRGGGGLLTPATDVYALGAILHEMLARRPLHGGESTFDVINSVLNDDAVPVRQFNPGIPAELEAVVLKSIEKSAGLRYPSAIAFSQDLERFLADVPVLARRPSRMTKLRKTASRHVVVVASAAALVVLGIVAAVILQSAPMKAPPPADPEMWRAHVDAGNRLLEQIVAKKRERGYERAEIKALAERAVLEYSKALAERPNDPAALVGQGRASALAGERQKALDAFAKAISAAPAMPMAYIERIRLAVEQYGELRNRGGDDASLKASIDADLDKIGVLAKDAPDGTYARGLLAFASAEYESAAKLLERYLAAADWDGAAHHWRGDALFRLRRPREAIASLTLALRADTGLLPAWICRADARADDGDLQGAIADYTEALRLDPHAAEVIARRGRLYADLKNWDAALADCTDALKLAPDNDDFLMDRGFVLERKGDLEGAISDYTKASERGARRGDAFYRRALVLRRKGDDDGALRDYDAAIRHVPQHAEALVSRGNLHLDRRDPRSALADYNTAIALKPGYASAYFGRGRARRLMGESRAAADDFTQCLACEPRFWQALNQRALLKRELGDAAGAIEDLMAALRISPDDPDLLVNLGNARRSSKDSRGAIEAYDRALGVDPAVLNAHFNRGLARLDLEQWEGAIADLTEAMRRQGPHADAFASRGLAKLGRGDKAGAVDDLQEAVKIAPQGWRHLDAIRFRLRELAEKK